MAIDPNSIDKLLSNYKKPEDRGEKAAEATYQSVRLERELEAKMSEPVGCLKHDPAGQQSGHSRNEKAWRSEWRFRRTEAGTAA
jgi:hypothetical protein